MLKYKMSIAYSCFQRRHLIFDGKYNIISDRRNHIFIHVKTCLTLTSPDNYYA